jgi:hypothetical protein
VHNVDLRYFIRYFVTEDSNWAVIKWEENMTELRETGNCDDNDIDLFIARTPRCNLRGRS